MWSWVKILTFRFTYAFIHLQSLLANIMLCAAERVFSCEPDGFSDFSGSSVSKEFACNAGDTGSVPGLGRSPGEGNDFPLQHSFLRSPMDRGTIVTRSWISYTEIQLKECCSHSSQLWLDFNRLTWKVNFMSLKLTISFK